jgi:hypothetical protein
LALLALAAIMFFVTIVKFEEQIHRDGVFRTRAETKPRRVRTPGAAALLSIGDASRLGIGNESKPLQRLEWN